MKKSTLAGFALVSLSALLPFAAEAAPVTVTFNGTYTAVGATPPPGVAVGAGFSLDLTYDPTTPVFGTGHVYTNFNYGPPAPGSFGMSVTTPTGFCTGSPLPAQCTSGTLIQSQIFLDDNFVYNGNPAFDGIQFSFLRSDNTLWNLFFLFNDTSAITGIPSPGPSGNPLSAFLPANSRRWEERPS